MAVHPLASGVGIVQLPKLSKDRTRYLKFLDSMERSISKLSLLSHSPDKPKWSFIRNRSQSRVVKDQKLGMLRSSSANYRKGRSLQQDPERCAMSRSGRGLDSCLRHIMACLQVSQQHFATEKMHKLQSEGRVLLFLRDYSRQRLHSDLENAP